MSILEVLDGSTHGSFELNDRGTVIGNLVVDDDVQFQSLGFQDTLQGLNAQIRPH